MTWKPPLSAGLHHHLPCPCCICTCHKLSRKTAQRYWIAHAYSYYEWVGVGLICTRCCSDAQLFEQCSEWHRIWFWRSPLTQTQCCQISPYLLQVAAPLQCIERVLLWLVPQQHETPYLDHSYPHQVQSMLVSSCKAAFSTIASDLPSPGFQLACFGGKLQANWGPSRQRCRQNSVKRALGLVPCHCNREEKVEGRSATATACLLSL